MIRGGCLCGAVRYEYDGLIEEISLCHCSQCRKAQGSAYVAVSPVQSARLRITHGQALLKEYRAVPHKARVFCANCGSPIYSARDDLPGIRRLRLGTVETPFSCSRVYHIHVDSKAAWEPLADGQPKFSGAVFDSHTGTAMENPLMSSGTVRFHRVLRAPAERVYRAFLNAEALTKWLPPHGFTASVQHLDARVGGSFRMSFTHFGNGQVHAFGGEYLELLPGERLRYRETFDGPNLAGVMQTTVDLQTVSCGTQLNIVQEGIPSVIPVEMCYLGWQESLVLLAQLVEAEIPAE